MACFSCYLGYLPSKGLFNRYSLLQVMWKIKMLMKISLTNEIH